jgi:hypothetical protein
VVLVYSHPVSKPQLDTGYIFDTEEKVFNIKPLES